MSNLDPELQALTKRYISKVRENVTEMLTISSELEEGNKAKVYIIKDVAHRLKGSGKGYGFHAISFLGGRLEEECEKFLRGRPGNGNGDLNSPLYQIKRNLEELSAFCEMVDKEIGE